MPVFDFTGPDGKSYSVEGPEGATAEQAFGILQSQLGSTSKPDYATDIAKSAAVGVANGAIGLAGLIPDIAGGIKSVSNKYLIDPILEKTIGLPTRPNPQAWPDLNKTFGSENIKKNVESVTGEFYKPQTLPGQFAETAGEFLPGGMAGGGRTLLGKLGTNVIAPAIGSFAAQKAAEGTGYERVAGVVGGLAGGVAANKMKEVFSPAAAKSITPAAEDLLSTASKQFENVKRSGAIVDPQDAQIVAQGIRNSLEREGFNAIDHAPVFRAVDRLEKSGQYGPVSMNDMESIRKNLVAAKMSSDGATRAAAKQATKELMDYMPQIVPTGVRDELVQAIGNYAAGKRSNVVMGKADLGELNAQTAGAGANTDNALRQSIKQLVRPVNNDIVPKAKTLGFNEAEIAAMNDVARGTLTGNIARLFGKAAPTGIVSGAGSTGLGYALGGPIGAAVLPVAGYISKKVGDMSTKQGIKALDDLVRSRSPLAVQVAAQNPQLASQLPQQSYGLLSSLITSVQSARNRVNEQAGPSR